MDDLLTWFNAQLDATEAIAKDILDKEWTVDLVPSMTSPDWEDSHHYVDGPQAEVAANWRHRLELIHIAEWDPARALRWVAAARKIVDGPHTGSGPDSYDEWGCAVRALASVYADQPGWREEWE